MTTWLPNSWFKGFDQPKLITEPFSNQTYGGYYVPGTKEIVVVEAICDKDFANTIAHECVHYMQWTLGKVFPKSELELFSVLPYNLAIRQYFKTNTVELEALELSHRYSPSSTSRFWIRGCVYSKTCDPLLQQ